MTISRLYTLPPHHVIAFIERNKQAIPRKPTTLRGIVVSLHSISMRNEINPSLYTLKPLTFHKADRYAVRSQITALSERTLQGAVRFLESDSECNERSDSERKQTV